MSEAAHPRQQALEARAMAARARRLAREMGESGDRDRLLHYAEELERRARQLDAEASLRPHAVEQEQQQVQQQGPAGSANTSGGKKPV